MKGYVVVNGYYSSEASRHQADRLLEALRQRSVDVSVYRNNRPWLIGETLSADFAVFFDKDVNLARALERNGTRVFNSAKTIEDSDDKVRCNIILQSNGVPVTQTIPSPKKYSNETDGEFLREVGNTLGYPLVVKASCGSMGREVFLAESYGSLMEIDRRLGSVDRLYQRYNAESKGKSIRAIVIGGKALCAMKLTNEKDFRSNAYLGGKGEEIILTESWVEVAETAAKALDADYCGVDLFCDKPEVIEVNSNAYFLSMEKVTGCDVAASYADYIIGRMRE